MGQANRARSEAPVQARRVMPSRAQTRTVSSLSFKLAAARRSAPPRCNDLLCLLQHGDRVSALLHEADGQHAERRRVL
jgi:hypothetical protein